MARCVSGPRERSYQRTSSGPDAGGDRPGIDRAHRAEVVPLAGGDRDLLAGAELAGLGMGDREDDPLGLAANVFDVDRDQFEDQRSAARSAAVRPPNLGETRWRPAEFGSSSAGEGAKGGGR